MLPSSSCRTTVCVPWKMPGDAAREPGGVLAERGPGAAGLDADQPDAGLVDERVEDPHRVAAAAHARHDRVGHARRPRPRTARGPRRRSPTGTRGPSAGRDAGRAPIRAGSASSPTLVTQSRMASLMASFSVRLPASTRRDRRAEQPHADDVQRLARHVVGAHVDLALQAQQRAGRRRGHAVLARAGLGHDARLAHPRRQQRLAERVVDLVRAGVRQVLALEEDARAARRRPRGGAPRRAASAGPRR